MSTITLKPPAMDGFQRRRAASGFWWRGRRFGKNVSGPG